MTRPSAYAGRGRPAWMDLPATDSQRAKLAGLVRRARVADLRAYAERVLGRDLPDGCMTGAEASVVIDALRVDTGEANP